MNNQYGKSKKLQFLFRSTLFYILFSALSLFAAENVVELESIVVTEPVHLEEFVHRYEALGELQFDAEELTKLPSVGEADLSRALKYLPGVSAANENSSELIVHGGAPEQNLTMLDDIPLYSIDHFFGFFSPFNSDAISSVKLYRGFAPAWFDDRLSSVVQYRRKEGSSDTIESSVNASMLSLSGMISGPLTRRGSIIIAGRRSYSDLVETPLYESIFHQFSNDGEIDKDLENFQVNRDPSFHFYDLNGGVSYKIAQKDSLTASFYLGKDNLSTLAKAHSTHLIQLNPTPLSIVPRSVDIRLENSGFWGNIGFSGSWIRRWSESLESKVTVGRSKYFFGNEEDFYTGAIVGDSMDAVPFQSRQNRSSDNSLTDFFGSIHTSNFTDRHTIAGGIDFHRFSTSYNQQESYHKLTGDSQGGETELYSYLDSSNVTELSQNKMLTTVWAQETFVPAEKLTVVGGIRGNLYEGSGKMHISPRLSVVWDPHKLVSFRANETLIHQFLHRSPMYDLYLEGDRYYWILADKGDAPVSRSEKSTVGCSFKPAGFLIDFEGYYNRQHGLSIYRESFTPSAADFSVGEGWTRGIDMLVQKNLKWYTGWVSYSLSRSIQQFGHEVNHGKPFVSPCDHPQEIKIVNMFDIKKFNATITWVYASGASFETPVGTYQPDYFSYTTTTFGLGGWKNSERMPEYHRLDVSTSYKFTPGKHLAFTLNGSVFNCYNRKNIRGYGFEHTMEMNGKNVNELQIYRTESYYLGIVPSLSLSAELKQPLRGSR